VCVCLTVVNCASCKVVAIEIPTPKKLLPVSIRLLKMLQYQYEYLSIALQ